MVARRLNSAVKDLWPRCQMRICVLWYPQSWHSLNLFFTPLPQPVHGCVLGPCLRRARWILQCSPKQLLPHYDMEPITNHLHVFWPFIVTVWYTQTMGVSNRKCPHPPGGPYLVNEERGGPLAAQALFSSDVCTWNVIWLIYGLVGTPAGSLHSLIWGWPRTTIVYVVLSAWYMDFREHPLGASIAWSEGGLEPPLCILLRLWLISSYWNFGLYHFSMY